jgi:hypothetical protein
LVAGKLQLGAYVGIAVLSRGITKLIFAFKIRG